LRWVQAAKRSLITLGAALAGKLKPLKAPKKKNEEVDEDDAAVSPVPSRGAPTREQCKVRERILTS
jgi:hypothetical protein